MSLRKLLEVALAALLGKSIVDVVEEAAEEVRESKPYPEWPPVPASRQYELTLPTREPIERVEAPRPPFTGLRVELGEGPI